MTARQRKLARDSNGCQRLAAAHNAPPMYLTHALQYQSNSNHKPDSRCEMFDQFNRYVIYYLGAYMCNLDLHEDAVSRRSSNCANHTTRATSSDARWTRCHSVWSRAGRLLRSAGRHFRGRKQSKWKRRLRFGWIPHVLLVSFLISIAYLLAALYYQYVFDFDLLRLVRLESIAGGNIGNQLRRTSGQVKAKELEIMSRVADAKIMASLLCPDYSHLTILVECFYLSVIALAITIYFSLYVHYRFLRPFDYHVVRDLLDSERETNNVAHMVAGVIKEYAESSKAHHENTVDCNILGCKASVKFAERCRSIRLTSNIARFLPASNSLKKLHSYEVSLQMVREMHRSGALTPLNRTCAWVRERSALQFTYHIWLAVYSIVFDTFLLYGFFAQVDPKQDGQPTHYLVQAACVAALFAAAPSVVVHAAVFMIVSLDQIHYLKELSKLIRVCIDENSRKFSENLESSERQAQQRAQRRAHEMRYESLGIVDGHLLARETPPIALCIRDERESLQVSDATCANDDGYGDDIDDATLTVDCASNDDEEPNQCASGWSYERTMNGNFIFCLLHYKIFVAQLLPIKRSLGIVNLLSIAILFTIPLITRIHEPYIGQLSFGRLSDSQMKIFALIISSSVLLPANLAMFPLCLMFTRCKTLYRDLSSLLVHVSDVQAHPRGQDIYDSYAASSLIKELSDSECFLERLTVRAGRIAGTFAVLVKAHFWYGLITISIMADNRAPATVASLGANPDVFTWMFKDPLRVYSELDSWLRKSS